MPEYLRLDLFPAKVYAFNEESSGNLATARVVVTNDEAFVFGDGPTGVEVKWSGRLEDFTGDNKQGYTIVLHDGTTLQVARSGGCGCGTRLRGFQPFPGVPYLARNA